MMLPALVCLSEIGSCDALPQGSGAEDAQNARSHPKKFFEDFRFWGMVISFCQKSDNRSRQRKRSREQTGTGLHL